MANPQPGKPYTIIKGDTLYDISNRTYGRPDFWPRIWRANQKVLKSGDPNLIFPGEVIYPPNIAERKLTIGKNIKNPEKLRTTLASINLGPKDKDSATLLLENREIPLESMRVTRALDTGADGWSTSIAWVPGLDTELDKLVVQYSYAKASVYLGSQLVVNGSLYQSNPEITKDGIKRILTGYSFTIDAVDSSVRTPYEVNGRTLEQRASEMVAPLGISAVFLNDSGGPFKRMTANKTDTIFSHLVKYAKQRALLVTSSPQGNLLFTQANLRGRPVTTIEFNESTPNAEELKANFDGRKRFNAYKAIGRAPGRKNKGKTESYKFAISKDDSVPRARFKTFQADDTTGGNIQKAADWEKNKQLAKAFELSIPVDSWYSTEENLWTPNTLVTLKSEVLGVPDGFDLLIKQVEYIFEKDGTRAVLGLIPPQTYTTEPIAEPWKK